MGNINRVDLDLKRDIQEIASFIENYIDSTYLSKIRGQIQTQKRECRKMPLPEVQLLEAIVPFVEGEMRTKLTNMVKLITYSKMIEKMVAGYGGEELFTRTQNEKGLANDYIYQGVVVLVLYQVIIWAEEASES